jgi:hypothetical protein
MLAPVSQAKLGPWFLPAPLALPANNGFLAPLGMTNIALGMTNIVISVRGKRFKLFGNNSFQSTAKERRTS